MPTKCTQAELDAFRASLSEDHRRPVPRPAAAGAAAALPPARPPTAFAKPCSRCWPAASARSRTCASPTSLRAAARWASRLCRAAPPTHPSSRPTEGPGRDQGQCRQARRRRSGPHPRRFGARSAAVRAVRPGLRRPALCAGSGSAVVEGGRRRGLARTRRLDVGRDRARRAVDPATTRSRPSANSAAPGLRFCAGLSLPLVRAALRCGA